MSTKSRLYQNRTFQHIRPILLSFRNSNVLNSMFKIFLEFLEKEETSSGSENHKGVAKVRFKFSSSNELVIELYNYSSKDYGPMPYLRTTGFFIRNWFIRN